MLAAQYEIYGDPSEILQLKEVPKPIVKPNELLVRVCATTVNRTDEGIVTARYVVSRLFSGLIRPKKKTPGTDFAGIVEAKGDLVSGFNRGDRIFGFNDEGLESQAEYLAIPATKAICLIPESISFQQAAASVEGFHYARNFLNKITLQSGDTVLVNGATGAIGSAAVQLLNHHGAKVTAVANTPNIDLVKSLGAIQVIDYLKTDFTKETGSYKVVLDAVGKSSFKKCKPLLEKRGVYISSELGSWGINLFLALYTPLFSSKKVFFPLPTNIKKTLLLVTKLLEEQQFQPVIDRVYELKDIVEAYKYVQKGQKIGNVILSMMPSKTPS